MFVEFTNKGFIKTLLWKAVMAKESTYTPVPYIPMPSIDRKNEIVRRLRKIRATQPNLRTQVRLENL